MSDYPKHTMDVKVGSRGPVVTLAPAPEPKPTTPAQNYSTDADLIKWEPSLFRDLKGKRLAAGCDGDTEGISFVSLGAHFQDVGIRPGHVIQILGSQGEAEGCFQVLSLQSQTELLATSCGWGVPVDLPSGEGWVYAIDTFDDVAHVAKAEVDLDLCLDADSKRDRRRASIFYTLAWVFEEHAGADERGRNMAAKAALYRRLYAKEIQKLQSANPGA